jgi:uncharacterized protein YaaN involved in tellurite resistance
MPKSALDQDKPEGPLTQLFNRQQVNEWHTKAKAIEEKILRIVAKIEALQEEILTVELGDGNMSETVAKSDSNHVSAAAKTGTDNGGILSSITGVLKRGGEYQ